MSSPWDYFGQTGPEAGFAPPAPTAPRPAGPIAPHYLDAIKKFEGYTPKPTWDYKQWSSGFGTRAKHPGEVIDKATAEQRLQEELSKARGIVDKFSPNAPDGAKAALTSLTYNAGDAWTRSGLGQSVQAGDWNGARQRFLQYNKAGGQTLPGLASRRAEEAKWMTADGSSQPQGKTMGDYVSPFEANQGMGLSKQPGIMDARAKLANADGTLGPQYADGQITPALLAKHGINVEGAKDMMGVYNLQRELMGGAFKAPEMNAWDGLSIALGTIGAGLHAKAGQGQAAMSAANSVGQGFREAAEHSRKLKMQSAIQQSQLLGTNIDAAIKEQAAHKRKRQEALDMEKAIQDAKTGGATALPAPTAPQAPQMPVVPPHGVATGVPGSVLGEPIPAAGGPPTGQQPAMPPQDQSRPAIAPVSPEEANLRAAGDVAWRAGNAERAKQLHAQADARRAEVADQTKPTNDIREYQLYAEQAKKEGKPPVSFFDYQKELKASGRNMVTIDQRQETEEAKALGKGAGERANSMIARGQGATTTIQKLSTLEAIQDRVQTGRLAGAKLTAGQWAKELGVGEKQLEAFGIGKNFVGDAQTLQAQTSRMLVDMLGSGGFPSNNFSNADREFIEKTLPNLGNDPRGNRLMMAFMKRAAERDRDQYKAWTKAKETPGMSFDKFALQWGEKVEAEDALGDLRKEAEAILGATTPTAKERKAAQQVPVATKSQPKPVSTMAQPKTAEDYAALKSGTPFLDPNGVERVKP